MSLQYWVLGIAPDLLLYIFNPAVHACMHAYKCFDYMTVVQLVEQLSTNRKNLLDP